MSAPLLHPAARRRYAILCPGFAADRVRRQPWHVADGLARGLAMLGHAVSVITDASDTGMAVPYAVVTVPELFAEREPALGVRIMLGRRPVDRVFLITGAAQLARLRRLELNAPVTLVMASPRLRLREILRLHPAALWHERRLLGLPLVNALLPGFLLRAGFRRSGAAGVVYLSAEAQKRFMAAGLPAGRRLVPRIDPAALLPPPVPAGDLTIGYFGPPLALRGAWLALEAFEVALARGLDARLLLVLRPDSGPAGMARFLARVARSSARTRITTRTEMLPAEALARELARCHAFLLPFLAPVSEVPLVVIEACLSGRPTIVLDAPGVAEYARALGGIVAAGPSQLPGALIDALRRPVAVTNTASWTVWDQAVAPLLDAAPPAAHHRLIAFAGVDGSGKTCLLRGLQDRLDAAGVPHRHVWSRFRNYLSKPLLALARLTGHNRKEQFGAVRVGYHEFQHAPWLAWPFLLLQAVDAAFDIWWRYHRPRSRAVILGDRCVYDTLVDLAVDTGLDEVVFGRLGRWLVGLLPEPRLVVVLNRDVARIRASRPDALLDRYFARRRVLYQRLARTFDLPVIDNNGPPEAALAALGRLLAANPPAERAVR